MCKNRRDRDRQAFFSRIYIMMVCSLAERSGSRRHDKCTIEVDFERLGIRVEGDRMVRTMQKKTIFMKKKD